MPLATPEPEKEEAALIPTDGIVSARMITAFNDVQFAKCFKPANVEIDERSTTVKLLQF